MKRIVIAALIIIPLAAISTWALACPCATTPGLYLRGVESRERVTDWSFANKVPLCQIQVSGLIPQALNLYCWANSTGELFLSCGNCAAKSWSAKAVANGQARLRLDKTVYPVTVTRVVDAGELDRVWEARAAKMGNPENARRSDQWWSFRVVSR